jgi:uncharacterized protein (DUF1697 family)
MHTYICLLRAVNVGGTGKLPMADLRAMCEAAGFLDVQTYVASGNVVVRSASNARNVQATLEATLEEYAGKPVGVMIRTPAEMASVLSGNPFPDAAPNRVMAIFLNEAPPHDALKSISGQNDEQLALGAREIYVHYGNGMGNSKLKIPAAKAGTARNINTVSKLVEMAGK